MICRALPYQVHAVEFSFVGATRAVRMLLGRKAGGLCVGVSVSVFVLVDEVELDRPQCDTE